MHEKDKVNMIFDSEGITVVGTGAGNARALGATPGETAAITDKIDKAPDLTGPHGRAWLCDFHAGLRKLGISKEDDAAIAHWVIEAPWAHPIWHSYSIVLMHLRPLRDQRPTIFHLPDATHEMHVYALDPEKSRREMIKTGIPDKIWLQPTNFAAQFIEVTDELAAERIRKVVAMICAGDLSPDTDWRRQWVELFNDKMIKKEFR